MPRADYDDRRARRRVSAAVGAFVILAVGLYGPVTLLPPLPAATAEVLELTPPANQPTVVTPILPTEGASAVLVGGTSAPLGTSGSTEPVPIAGAAKVIAALVVLDEHPLEVGRNGESIPITADDYASYLSYRDGGARAIPVVEGDTWTEREILQAVMLGSSNNHAETLVRWGFGSLDDYAVAAGRWLADNGMTATTVVDPTGLDERNVGTATDLARIAEFAGTDPIVRELLASPDATTSRGVSIANEADFKAVDGVRGISRSFTDAAGVCLLFSVPLPLGETTTTVYGAFLRQPSYEALNSDMDGFLASARASVGRVALTEPGIEVARYRSAWGERTSALTRDGLQSVGWIGAPPSGRVLAEEVRTVQKGGRVGALRFEVEGQDRDVALVASSTLTDPGPGWRLLNPGPMIGSFFDWAFARS